jgi:hypothetical protein
MYVHTKNLRLKRFLTAIESLWNGNLSVINMYSINDELYEVL